jgi:hypothetical protein
MELPVLGAPVFVASFVLCKHCAALDSHGVPMKPVGKVVDFRRYIDFNHGQCPIDSSSEDGDETQWRAT